MGMNAVQVKQESDNVRGLLEKMKSQFEMALPQHVTPDRLIRVALTAVQNTPKLLECDRRSLLSAVMTCAQLGLEPDGVLGQAYLVPFKGKVQFIAGYKGLLSLAYNSGDVTSLKAMEVCQNDEFSYEYGLDEHLRHKPAGGDRGDVIAFYAYARLKGGGFVFEIMSRAEVEKVRDNSEGYKAFKAGYTKSTPWHDHFVQMGRKTLIRRLSNYLPRSVQKAAAFEDAIDRGVPAVTNDFGEIVLLEDHSAEGAETVEEKRDTATRSKMDALAGKAAAEDIDPDTGEITEKQPPKERVSKAETAARATAAKAQKAEPAAPAQETVASGFAREVEQEAAPAKLASAGDPDIPAFLRREAPKKNGGFAGFSDDA